MIETMWCATILKHDYELGLFEITHPHIEYNRFISNPEPQTGHKEMLQT